MAAALHHGPPVLLADEPTVGQDRRTWAAVVGLVAAYRSAGGAVVAATHDAHVVDRATVVHRLETPPRAAASVTARGVPLVARCGPLALLVGALLAVPAGVALAALDDESGRAGDPARARAGRPLRARAGDAIAWSPARDGCCAMVPGLVAALSVGWSTWFLAGRDLDPALTVALRVLVIVLPSAVLIPWIDPDRLGDHLAQRLRLPGPAGGRDVGRAAAGALLRRDLGRARPGPADPRPRRLVALASSVAAHLGALTMGLLVRTLRAAADLAVAMDARGFATARARSWWMPAPWRWRDTLLVALATVPTLVAVVAG